MKYIKARTLTYDIEATYGKSFGRVSNPFSEDTGLCCMGQKLDDGKTWTDYFVEYDEERGMRWGDHNLTGLKLGGVQVLVGVNIKFDLLWSMSRGDLENLCDFFHRGGMLWDCAYAEYLISGMAVNNGNIDERFRCSMNAIASMNGIKDQKLDLIKKLWDEGVRTEDIHEDLLLEYQGGDVDLTYKIYQRQLKRAVEMGPGFMANLRARMRSLMATTFMEFNGLRLDKLKGLEMAKVLKEKLDGMHADVAQYIPELPFEFNPRSNKQLSAFLFGGTVKYDARVPRVDKKTGALIYKKVEVPDIDPKTGKQKQFIRGKNKGKLKYVKVPGTEVDTKWGKKNFTFPRQFEPEDKWAAKEEGFFSVAADVIKTLHKEHKAPALQLLMDIAKLDKNLGTYYIKYNKDGKAKGMLTFIGPDQLIHHGLQHYVTATGRLSCTNPNLQNVPGEDKSDVKGLFISRFGAEGTMMEADYSQLEVVTKTVLCKDAQLRADLLDGVCFHCVNLALAEHMDPWEVQMLAKGIDKDSPLKLREKFGNVVVDAVAEWQLKRKKIKPFTFQEKYGGGAALMAESTGLSVDEIKEIIEEKKKRYPQEAAFDEQVFKNAVNSISPSPFRTPKGMPAGIGYHYCETHTLYSFVETDAPDWKKDRDGQLTAIKPTQTKNYPSQGLGGFIMQDAIGIIMLWLLSRKDLRGKVYLVNTVHDCCWLDCHNSVRDKVAAMVRAIMQDVNWRFEQMFGELEGWDVPFPAEVETGQNMLDLEHWHGDLPEPYRINY